jgi:hypothetical protein
MPRGLPVVVRTHLDKAREAAILAVEVYNKPAVTFRSGSYIVLMCIAWTSLFHAIYFSRGVKPFYRDRKRKGRYLKVDGDYKAWELAECIKQYFGSSTCPERTNLEFFVSLRNKVEHRSMPSLDPRIFGECQALLFNFEDLVFKEFGPRYALNESLSLALQFSRLRDEKQSQALEKLHRPLAKDVDAYIKAFRSSLTAEEFNDLRFSFKVFLIPKTANHLGKDTVAVEYVRYDPSKPEEMEKYEKLVSLVKTKTVPVVHPGGLKPGAVCDRVEPIVRQVAGADKRFHPSYHHLKACYYYRIRPRKGEGDPRNTEGKFCQYDEAHEDYVYTEAWACFLANEMAKPGQYELIMGVDLTGTLDASA